MNPVLYHQYWITSQTFTMFFVIFSVNLQVSMYGYKPDPKSTKIVTYTEENCK